MLFHLNSRLLAMGPLSSISFVPQKALEAIPLLSGWSNTGASDSDLAVRTRNINMARVDLPSPGGVHAL
jgi:hypothetical protein